VLDRIADAASPQRAPFRAHRRRGFPISPRRTHRLCSRSLKDRPSSILEIRELAEIYNRAAASVPRRRRRSSFRLPWNLSALWPAPLDARDGLHLRHQLARQHLSAPLPRPWNSARTSRTHPRRRTTPRHRPKSAIADSVLAEARPPHRRKSGSSSSSIRHRPPQYSRACRASRRTSAPVRTAPRKLDGTGYPKGQSGTEYAHRRAHHSRGRCLRCDDQPIAPTGAR